MSDSAFLDVENVSPDLQSKFDREALPNGRRKGGLRTMPFIIANEAFEKVASYGLLSNMILYLMGDYNMSIATGTNLLYFWSAATNFLPIVGAFLSDSFLSRFVTISFGSVFCLLGMALLWLTAMIPSARPPPCDKAAHNCKAPTCFQVAMLICSFALMSIGAGGVRPCSLAFGADQFGKKENRKNKRGLETYMSWYYASATVSVLIAFTGIVYIQDRFGWKVGFGIPVILMFLSAFLFVVASPLYTKQKASRSLFTGFGQVLVVAYKNRKLALPPQNSYKLYHHQMEAELVLPTNQLRFLNKACIITNPEQDLTQHGLASNPWRLCTVEQVEEVKSLFKVIPLWSTGIMVSINMSQGSINLLQARSMDRHVTSSFQIPAASFGMFTIVALALWIALYDRVLLPLASKLKGKPFQISAKRRIGIGLFLSFVCMVVSGLVEHIRRRKAFSQGSVDDPHAVLDMSAMWLVPQHILSGIAEAFNAIGQNEFYYSEFPKTMSSIATCLFGLGMSVASLLASAILSTVKEYSKSGGNDGWISDNINKGHYDYYFWLLAAMSFINFAYFLLCSRAYGTTAGQGTKFGDAGREGFEDEPSKS